MATASQPSSSPSSPSASSASRLDRRQSILRATFDLIAERGLEGLRFGDVARRAHINNGTLLYYFPSKQALVQGVVDYLLEDLSSGAMPRPTDQPLDARAELRWEFEDARRRLNGPLGVVYLELLVRAQRDAAVAEVLRQLERAWDGWLVSLVERGQRAGVFRAGIDAGTVSTLVRAMIRGLGCQTRLEDVAAVDRAMSALIEAIEVWLVA